MATSAGFRFRPGQSESIDQILSYWATGYDTVILDAPVGSGKSLTAATVARRLHETSAHTGFYSTPLVSLVRQIQRDPLVGPQIATVSGRRNYPCDVDSRLTADEAQCVVGKNAKSVEENCPSKANGTCGYYLARDRAQVAPLAGMTLSYLLAVTIPRGHVVANEEGEPVDDGEALFPPRDFLILDEAHNLDRAGISSLTFSIDEATLDDKTYLDYWRTAVYPEVVEMESYSPTEIREFLSGLKERVGIVYRTFQGIANQLDDTTPAAVVKRVVRRAREARSLFWKIRMALANPGEPWMISVHVDPVGGASVEIGPIIARSFLRQRLWGLAPKRLLMSGTFGPLDIYLRDVGLDPETTKVISIPSHFPAENGPIFFSETPLRLNKDTLPTAIPLVAVEINAILAKERDRGLIHVNSYKLASALRMAIDPRYAHRIVFHDEKDRNPALEKWIEDGRPDTVFLAVDMTDGLDLAGEKAEFQIIVKAPYPDLGDRRVKARYDMEDGENWYRAAAQKKLQQALGRIVRSETDRGNTYVVDKNACDLLVDRGTPSWVFARIREGGKIQQRRRAKPWE